MGVQINPIQGEPGRYLPGRENTGSKSNGKKGIILQGTTLRAAVGKVRNKPCLGIMARHGGAAFPLSTAGLCSGFSNILYM